MSLKKIKEEKSNSSDENKTNSGNNSIEEIKEFEPIIRDKHIAKSIQFPPPIDKSGFTSALMKSKIKDFEV